MCHRGLCIAGPGSSRELPKESVHHGGSGSCLGYDTGVSLGGPGLMEDTALTHPPPWLPVSWAETAALTTEATSCSATCRVGAPVPTDREAEAGEAKAGGLGGLGAAEPGLCPDAGLQAALPVPSSAAQDSFQVQAPDPRSGPQCPSSAGRALLRKHHSRPGHRSEL